MHQSVYDKIKLIEHYHYSWRASNWLWNKPFGVPFCLFESRPKSDCSRCNALEARRVFVSTPHCFLVLNHPASNRSITSKANQCYELLTKATRGLSVSMQQSAWRSSNEINKFTSPCYGVWHICLHLQPVQLKAEPTTPLFPFTTANQSETRFCCLATPAPTESGECDPNGSRDIRLWRHFPDRSVKNLSEVSVHYYFRNS
jgi:hypothetical protein